MVRVQACRILLLCSRTLRTTRRARLLLRAACEVRSCMRQSRGCIWLLLLRRSGGGCVLCSWHSGMVMRRKGCCAPILQGLRLGLSRTIARYRLNLCRLALLARVCLDGRLFRAKLWLWFGRCLRRLLLLYLCLNLGLWLGSRSCLIVRYPRYRNEVHCTRRVCPALCIVLSPCLSSWVGIRSVRVIYVWWALLN